MAETKVEETYETVVVGADVRNTEVFADLLTVFLSDCHHVCRTYGTCIRLF